MIEIIESKETGRVTNEMRIEFAAISDNESFARMAIASFITPLNPTLEELSDVKTAISEAVTNAVIHGYENRGSLEDKVRMNCRLFGDVLEVEVTDRGDGTALYLQAGTGTFRHGVCVYGSVYGQFGSAVGAGRRDKREDV